MALFLMCSAQKLMRSAEINGGHTPAPIFALVLVSLQVVEAGHAAPEKAIRRCVLGASTGEIKFWKSPDSVEQLDQS
jgi:hypothetical protein